MGVAGKLNNLNIEMVVTDEEAVDGLEAALGMEVEEDKDIEDEEGGEGTQRTWEPLSSSLRMQSRAELHLLMPVMILTSCAAWQCCGLRGTAGRQGQGSSSIDISIGRNFYSAIRGSHQLQP